MYSTVLVALALLPGVASFAAPARLPTAQQVSLKNDKNLDMVFANNKKWVSDMLNRDPEFFDRLGSGQTPPIMWIGCADSRVPESMVTGLDPGDVFVIRNVANQVFGNDLGVQGAVQFGVEALGVNHIVVCGHYECGGIKASLSNVDHAAPLELWVRRMRDIYRIHRAELDAITDEKARFRRMVEINVVEQCIELYKTSTVQRIMIESAKNPDSPYPRPRIHAMVFDPADGLLRKLPLNLAEIQENLGPIFNMYEIEGGVPKSFFDDDDFAAVPGLTNLKVSGAKADKPKNFFEKLFA